jgi:hypothetical protein
MASYKEPTMLPDLLAKTADVPRDKLFWGVIGALVVGQLLAFWMLCTHQVRKAEVRDATLQVQRVAVADCLRYIPKATLHGCANRVDPSNRTDGAVMAAGETQPAPGGAARTTMSSATPVNFSYR